MLLTLAAGSLVYGYYQASNEVPPFEELYRNGSYSYPYFDAYPEEITNIYDNFKDPALLMHLIKWLGDSAFGPVETFALIYSTLLLSQLGQKILRKLNDCDTHYKREGFNLWNMFSSLFYSPQGNKDRLRLELPNPFEIILKHAPKYLVLAITKYMNWNFQKATSIYLSPELDNPNNQCPITLKNIYDCLTSVILQSTSEINHTITDTLIGTLKIAVPLGVGTLIAKQCWDIVTGAITYRTPEKVRQLQQN
ncbi:MAG: hypothetical protein KKI20_06200 [Gammaproteobacteria bacterium]|nr:hypothetical protein [Gammaproteobacteria bacterium]MBU2546431.1 hypothetical protein [Gammaproteobacteria bacterium]